MDTFSATRCETVVYSPMPSGQVRGHGFAAPGRVVLVLREGAGWVRPRDGAAEPLAAPSVVAWEKGEWVEYGSDGSRSFRAELYWEAGLPADQQAAVLKEAFGALA
jgi:hypothetical protein